MKHTFYAIQQLSTGQLLPAPRGRGGRGGTRVEFTDVGMPRLFHRESSADTALRWWLAGEVYVSHTNDHNGDYDEHWDVVKQDHRDANDTAVVEVEIILKGPRT